MPGYEMMFRPDSGDLSWSWAQDRLAKSHNYWVATTRADGRPHVMPVWAVWLEGALYFSTARTSRKARNLARNPRCVVTTEGADEAVILEGTAEVIDDPSALKPVWAAYQKKYEWDLEGESMFAVRPSVAFGFIESVDESSGNPTRWRFD
ncbi:MAG: pyridoxamine 5'-phosphate oxidase family protein [Chloroflexi bacterium]|nr:pyridoxamine 5'-phosphate oxidase family protein [Chloroflexota bacterium]